PVYFNHLSGQIQQRYGNYEMDYYMNSIKHSSEWLKEKLIKEKSGAAVIVASNCAEQVRHYLRDMDNVEVVYVRHAKRDQKDWDYAIFNSRYVNRMQLLNGSWPMQKTIHAEMVGPVPISVVVERPSKSAHLGYLALLDGDPQKATEHYINILQLDPQHEVAWFRLGLAYFEAKDIEQAMGALDKCLTFYPDKLIALDLKGGILLQQQYIEQAKQIFDHMLKVNPYYSKTYHNLGV
ncbi:MAG: tetratricopeptide repeat protein, partial [Bacteroidetes bacterium]|nr:tetratricopeptide repeat protein [Bacteroidota bacterium]